MCQKKCRQRQEHSVGNQLTPCGECDGRVGAPICAMRITSLVTRLISYLGCWNLVGICCSFIQHTPSGVSESRVDAQLHHVASLMLSGEVYKRKGLMPNHVHVFIANANLTINTYHSPLRMKYLKL